MATKKKSGSKGASTKKRSSSGTDAKSKKTVQKKMQRTMHEYTHHELKSGGNRKKVTNPKQAIAIGLSEARQAGAKKTAAKKSASKKK